MLATLKRLWLFNPDFSQYVANLTNLGNPGHDLILNAKNAQAAESLTARLNELAARVYRNGAGVDGLLNAYLAQISWSGALSSEDVVDFTGRRVGQVVLVPVESIRFRFEEGEGPVLEKISSMERISQLAPVLRSKQVKAVCERRCNNGWMSILETAVQPYLTPLIQAKPILLEALNT